MAVGMQSLLSEETLETVQDLIQLNIDSRDGYRMASEKLEDLTLASAFDFVAHDRELQADELSLFVARTGERPRHEGSYLAALQRTWNEIREMFSSDDRLAMLEEAERGEDAVKSAYEDALQTTTAGIELHDVLQEQFAQVKASHDRIRDLRDQYRCHR